MQNFNSTGLDAEHRGLPLMPKGVVGFRERAGCPVCQEVGFEVLWEGRFSDPSVLRLLNQFHYSADMSAAVGDQPFALVRCGGCGFAFHRWVIVDDWVPVVYRDWTDQAQVQKFEQSHGWENRFETGRGRVKLALRLRHLLARRFAGPLRLLDFGCGNGAMLMAAELLGFEAFGIDISASRADQATRQGGRVFADLAAFDAAVGGKVHALTLEQVLEHVTEPLGLLRALAERMEVGGLLYLAVPDCSGIAEPRDFTSFHKVQPIEHVNAFTPASLRDLARRAGFVPLRRPMGVVTTGVVEAMRSLGGLIWQPATTDVFFRRV